MPRKEKVKHPVLSMVPVKTEAPEEQLIYKKTEGKSETTFATEFSIERIAESINKAQGGRHHHHIAHAEKAVDLQHRWESLPIYHEGDYFPKKQLYTNFKRVLQDVLEKKA